MKAGDVVMFVDEGRYAKWFYGQLGVVLTFTHRASDGRAHCRVKWMQPVPYHGKFSTVSDFSANMFELVNKNEIN